MGQKISHSGDLVGGSPQSEDRDTYRRALTLQQWLDASAQKAKRTWPGIHISMEAFIDFLADHVRLHCRGTRKREALRVEDLWLVFGALSGDEKAVTTFRRLYENAAAAVLPSLRLRDHEREELFQHELVRLLIGGHDTPPQLQRFRGHCSLFGWLRLVLIRRGLRFRSNERRFEDRQVHEEKREADPVEQLATESNPENRYLRGVYLQDAYLRAFHEALCASLKDLDRQSRRILRYHEFDKLSIDEIASLCGRHRSSVARRLHRIKESVGAETIQRMAKDIGINRFEAQNIVSALMDNGADSRMSYAKALEDSVF